MHRWNSRGYNNTSGTRNRSNLSESSSTSSISARLWVTKVSKAFFSLLSILKFRGLFRKVNPINWLVSVPESISSCPCCSCPGEGQGRDSPDSHSVGCSSSSKSSSINNCNNSVCNDIPKPKKKKMTQILSKTMTLLGVAFLIHFIIMSTFAEREGHPHSYGYDENGRHHYTRRSQRSYRNEKHNPSPEENSFPPVKQQNRSDALFYTENSTVITAQIGSETYLPCAVRNLGSGVASWIRRRDYTLLTVGMGTYSNDLRFWVVHNRVAQNWELHIKPVKETDSGVYECQISTHPPSSIFIHLNVVEARAEILGEPEKHVRSGSTFELVCVLRESTEPPVYVFWFHNEKMINYDVIRGVVVNSDSEKSILTIQNAKKQDSGNYSCVPSNAKPTSIRLFILELDGEKPGALQQGSRNGSGRRIGSFEVLFVTTVAVFVLTAWLLTTNLNRNLSYLRQPPPSKGEEAQPIWEENLQLVRNSEECEESLQSLQPCRTSFRDPRLGLGKSACGDRDDTRLEEALRERIRLILSASRVYISEISYRRRQGSEDPSKFFPLSQSPLPDGDIFPQMEECPESTCPLNRLQSFGNHQILCTHTLSPSSSLGQSPPNYFSPSRNPPSSPVPSVLLKPEPITHLLRRNNQKIPVTTSSLRKLSESDIRSSILLSSSS